MAGLRGFAKVAIPASVRYMARMQWNHLRDHGLGSAVAFNRAWWRATLANRRGRSRYRVLSEQDIRAARVSNTVFVFGSGASLNGLGAADWALFRQHDRFGFNLFYFQHFVPVGFHLLRGTYYGDLRWEAVAREVGEAVRGNPCFAETIFVMQEEYTAELGNTLVGFGLLPVTNPIFRYHTARDDGPPTRSFRDGLRHSRGTLTDVVNFAYLAGWTDIVLVGVDMYDSRYFFLPPDETLGVDPATGRSVGVPRNQWRGQAAREPHNTLRNGMVELMGEWRQALAAEGVRLSVYNPRSLLAAVLPVYPQAGASDALRASL